MDTFVQVLPESAVRHKPAPSVPTSHVFESPMLCAGLYRNAIPTVPEFHAAGACVTQVSPPSVLSRIPAFVSLGQGE